MRTFCRICAHSQRDVIDQDLRAGRELRHLADEYGVRQPVLRHHRDEHVAGMVRSRRRTGAVLP